MKEGQIIESYGGKFAKVVRVSEDGGMFSLSAWVSSHAAAEVETVAVLTLNEFGISQVVKGGANVPGAEPVEVTQVTPKAEKKAK
ncbi:MAG: hypothetical protein C0429_09670 [Sphingopyxis sp.]|nr:hypothetical protein [Sphingopyxis sp.]